MTGPAFEARYRADPDPWGTLTDPYERDKRRRTLDACGPGSFTRGLRPRRRSRRLAAELAPRCARLLALDGAPSAIAAARTRLAPYAHAEARVAALPGDLPHGESFTLVVASEILDYLDDAALAATLAWIDAAAAGRRPARRRPLDRHGERPAPRRRRGGGRADDLDGRHRLLADDAFRLEVLDR